MKKMRFSALWMSYTGVLIALQIVLGNLVQVAFIEKQMNLGFLPIAVAGYLLGPVGGMIVAGMGDLLGTIIFGTGAYFPGFTVTAVIAGMIYGFVMSPQYQRWLSRAVRNRYVELAVRAFIAAALAAVAYVFLNSYWLTYFISSSYWIILVGRIPFNLAEVPVFTIVIMITCAAMDRLPRALLPEAVVTDRHPKNREER